MLRGLPGLTQSQSVRLQSCTGLTSSPVPACTPDSPSIFWMRPPFTILGFDSVITCFTSAHYTSLAYLNDMQRCKCMNLRKTTPDAWVLMMQCNAINKKDQTGQLLLRKHDIELKWNGLVLQCENLDQTKSSLKCFLTKA